MLQTLIYTSFSCSTKTEGSPAIPGIESPIEVHLRTYLYADTTGKVTAAR